MNALKNFFAKFKFKKTLTVETLWTTWLIFSTILVSLFIFGDWWLYQNFVVNKESVSVEIGRTVLLKKINLDNIGKHLRAEKAFLDNPALPFVRSPF